MIMHVALFGIVGLMLFLVLGLRYCVQENPGSTRLLESGNHEKLVVFIRGLAGNQSVSELEAFIHATFPDADLLQSTYEPSPLANIDPYRLANIIEEGIHNAYTKYQYKEVILIGYSMGAIVLRKAFVWGNGIEDDRSEVGPKGKHEWVNHVKRFVSLAGVNRGWTIDPKPKNMRFTRYVQFYLAEHFGRLTGTGNLLFSFQQGAPFIADLRVQWIHLARDPEEAGNVRTLPLVVHLLGDLDDIVSRYDSQDIAAAKDTRFITLTNTNHESIVSELSSSGFQSVEGTNRAKIISDALLKPVHDLPTDKNSNLAEDMSVTRLIYILHGIRDYGTWGEVIQKHIERLAPPNTRAVPPKYGYFPMAPFLLYWDRQENVRKFMDEYTENLARFPMAAEFDFIGHSNGTYIFASALQRYKTLRARRVFFAGSVVPKHYPWRAVVAMGNNHGNKWTSRIQEVKNVVADGDWVVAIFPRLFEQIAEWIGIRPVMGLLDIGSAGFRGFDDGADPSGRITNIKFVSGGHAAGIAVEGNSEISRKKITAISNYIINGDETGLAIFEDSNSAERWLDVLSNISWVVWTLLVASLCVAGYWAFSVKTIVGWIYLLVILALLNSV